MIPATIGTREKIIIIIFFFYLNQEKVPLRKDVERWSTKMIRLASC